MNLTVRSTWSLVEDLIVLPMKQTVERDGTYSVGHFGLMRLNDVWTW